MTLILFVIRSVLKVFRRNGIMFMGSTGIDGQEGKGSHTGLVSRPLKADQKLSETEEFRAAA